MSDRTELINLLNRAAAALETPEDLSSEDKKILIEDLCAEASALYQEDVEDSLAAGGLKCHNYQ